MLLFTIYKYFSYYKPIGFLNFCGNYQWIVGNSYQNKVRGTFNFRFEGKSPFDKVIFS